MQNIEPTLLNDIHMPRWNELPNVDLYLDQVVTFINSSLNSFILSNVSNSSKTENQVLTKTMINNYVKNKLIEPPKKKKYSKVQLAKLFVICILKQVYSIGDIGKLISETTRYFELSKAYNRFCANLEISVKNAFTRKQFPNIEKMTEEQYLLKNVVQSVADKLYVETKFLSEVKEKEETK